MALHNMGVKLTLPTGTAIKLWTTNEGNITNIFLSYSLSDYQCGNLYLSSVQAFFSTNELTLKQEHIAM